MKFDYICDNLPDGLVLMDEAFFDELNEDILYSFEILLDREGRTELIYDFEGEDWATVWERETVLIKDFCNAGKMFVFLFRELRIRLRQIWKRFPMANALHYVVFKIKVKLDIFKSRNLFSKIFWDAKIIM